MWKRNKENGNFNIGNLGKMKERLEKAPKGIKSKYHPIINKGYEFYSHTLQTIYNPKIMDDAFNEYLKDIIPTYFKMLIKKLEIILFI